ncbi:MAG: hypothetical protein KatS3mg054_0263 [Chloroflexus sp.]|nr:MAG: hypothetical protein KatS3mg054_0263 [Chloroflexus sp.]
MIESFFRWSEHNLGQSHYVLGYLIVLFSHNWPIIGTLGIALLLSIRLYRQPSRTNAVWLFSALLFGLGYEYEKHVAVELHHAIDMLFGFELAGWNRPLHFLVGPIINTGFVLITFTMVFHGLYLTFKPSLDKLVRRFHPARNSQPASDITAPAYAKQHEENYERAGNNDHSTQASTGR